MVPATLVTAHPAVDTAARNHDDRKRKLRRQCPPPQDPSHPGIQPNDRLRQPRSCPPYLPDDPPREGLIALGVDPENIHVDHGLTGTNRTRPGLREALVAVRAGDTLVVTKLDRLARSLPDARDIADELTRKGVSLSLGGSVYDPSDPVGRLLFNVLGMVAEFEADLIRMRTREGMAIAKAKGKLRGKQPKLTPTKRRHLLATHAAGTHTQAELAELFDVSRATIYREIQRAHAPKSLVE